MPASHSNTAGHGWPLKLKRTLPSVSGRDLELFGVRLLGRFRGPLSDRRLAGLLFAGFSSVWLAVGLFSGCCCFRGLFCRLGGFRSVGRFAAWLGLWCCGSRRRGSRRSHRGAFDYLDLLCLLCPTGSTEEQADGRKHEKDAAQTDNAADLAGGLRTLFFPVTPTRPAVTRFTFDVPFTTRRRSSHNPVRLCSQKSGRVKGIRPWPKANPSQHPRSIGCAVPAPSSFTNHRRRRHALRS